MDGLSRSRTEGLGADVGAGATSVPARVPLRDTWSSFSGDDRSLGEGRIRRVPYKAQGIVLIVARRKGQRIRIGENIEVVVTEVSRGEVRLGIVAPKQVTVVREEMRRAVEDANRAAAAVPVAALTAASSANDAPVSGEVRVVSELDVGAFSSSSAAGTRS